MRRIFIIGLFCILFGQATVAQDISPKYEMRAAWVTSLYGLDWPTVKANSQSGIERQKKELCLLLDKLKEANFNTILLHARARGDAFYESDIEPWDECYTGTTGKYPGYDPFQFAVDECHKRGMEIHAWIGCTPIGGAKHIAALGQKSVTRTNPKLIILASGCYYMNPGVPETKDYIARMAAEVTRKYDIDGVHLDYIRYPDEHVRFSDRATFAKYGNGVEYRQWRRNNITGIVRSVYQAVKKLKPWVKVSSSPVGKYKDTSRYSSKGFNAYHAVFQDPQEWLREGIQDIIFPMMYFKDNNFYPFALDWQEKCYGRYVFPGLGDYFLEDANWPIGEIERQINVLRQMDVKGQAHFRAKYVTRNVKGLFNLLHTDLYALPSLIPPMKFLDSIPPSRPKDVSLQRTGKRVELHWTAATDNTPGATVRYNLYASKSNPVNTSTPSNIITADLYGTSFTYDIPTDDSPFLHFAITAVDRFGNESKPVQFYRLNHDDSFIIENDGSSLILPPHKTAEAIYIVDITGRKIRRYSDSTQINIEDLPDGFYQLKAANKAGKLTLLGSFMK